MHSCCDPRRWAFHTQRKMRVLYPNKAITAVVLIKEMCLMQRCVCFHWCKAYRHVAKRNIPDFAVTLTFKDIIYVIYMFWLKIFAGTYNSKCIANIKCQLEKWKKKFCWRGLDPYRSNLRGHEHFRITEWFYVLNLLKNIWIKWNSLVEMYTTGTFNLLTSGGLSTPCFHLRGHKPKRWGSSQWWQEV